MSTRTNAVLSDSAGFDSFSSQVHPAVEKTALSFAQNDQQIGHTALLQEVEVRIQQEADVDLSDGFSRLNCASGGLNCDFIEKTYSQYHVLLELKENDVLVCAFDELVPDDFEKIKPLFESIAYSLCYSGSITLKISSDLLEQAPDSFIEHMLVLLGRKVAEITYAQTDSFSQKVSDRLKKLIAGCVALQSLDFTDCESLTGQELVDLALAAKNLRKLNCTRCTQLTDEHIKRLLGKKSGFVALSFAGCTQLTDEAFVQTLPLCQSLERLILAECKITDKTITSLQGLKSLTHLSLSKTKITNQALLTLAQAQSRLQLLDLSSCKGLSVPDLQPLLERHFYVEIAVSPTVISALDELIKSYPFVQKLGQKSEPCSSTSIHVFHYIQSLHPGVEFRFIKETSSKENIAKSKILHITLPSTYKVLSPPTLTPLLRSYLERYMIHLECYSLSHPLVRELASLVTTMRCLGEPMRVGRLIFPKLLELSMPGSRMSDDCFADFECPLVQILDITGCSELTITSFKRMQHSFPRLRALKAKNCCHLSYQAIADFHLDCRDLEFFQFSEPAHEPDMQSLTAVQASGLLQVLTNTKKAKYLSVIEQVAQRVVITEDEFGYLLHTAILLELTKLVERLQQWVKERFSPNVELSVTDDECGLKIVSSGIQNFDMLVAIVRSISKVKPVTVEIYLDESSFQHQPLLRAFKELVDASTHLICCSSGNKVRPIAQVFSLLKTCVKNKQLTLENWQLDANSAQNLAESQPELESLIFTTCQGLNFEEFSKNSKLYPKLTRLELKGMVQVSEADLNWLAKGFMRLYHLSFAGCKKVPDKLMLLLAKGFPNLQSLNVANCQFAERFLQEKECSFAALKELNLSCTSITDKGLEGLANNSSMLSTLDVKDTKVSLLGLEKILSKNLWIQKMNLSGCQEIDNAALICIARRCNMLRQLELRCCAKITESGVYSLYNTIPCLERVDITGASKITPLLQDMLVRYPRTSMRLTLDLQSGLSELAFEILLMHYYHVSSLHLVNCSQLNANLLSKLIMALRDESKSSNHLQELSIDHCEAKDNEIFAVLKALAPSLRSLQWTGTATFSGFDTLKSYSSLNSLRLRHREKLDDNSRVVPDIAILALAKEHKGLIHLELCGFSELSAEGVCSIFPHVKKLKTLTLTDCPLIGENEVRSLQSQTKKVAINRTCTL